MPTGARTVIPLALLSIMALLMVVADDGVITNVRVASVTANPDASSSPASLDLTARAVSPARADARTPVAVIAPVASAPGGTLVAETPGTPVPVAAASTQPMPTALPVATALPPVIPPTPTPRSVPTAAPPAACPADWFCYPRLGVSGPIVPYNDCAGGSDIGTAIRAFTCLSPRYLMGHAYTQFGAITAWRAGDVVTAYGQTFTITGALTARSCEPPPMPLAPLSLQTSLSPNGCGAVLIVQAR